MSSAEHVLVTGASGFIAKHVVRELLDAGYRVRGSVRSAARRQEVADAVRPNLADPADLDNRLTCVELDLERDEGWDEAMEGVDVLMHTASPLPFAQPDDERGRNHPPRRGRHATGLEGRAPDRDQARDHDLLQRRHREWGTGARPRGCMTNATGPTSPIRARPPMSSPRRWPSERRGTTSRRTRRRSG